MCSVQALVNLLPSSTQVELLKSQLAAQSTKQNDYAADFLRIFANLLPSSAQSGGNVLIR
jgi:hypothetical protein